MTLSTAFTDLRVTATNLSASADELVSVVHEDRPAHSEIAIIDQLAETVSRLSSLSREVLELASVVEPSRQITVLPRVAESLAEFSLLYWRDLRSAAGMRALRREASEHGREWLSWHRSLELSAGRCEAPMLKVEAALRGAWGELAATVVLDGEQGRLVHRPMPVTFPPLRPPQASDPQ